MKSRRFILMLALMAFSLSSLYAQNQRKEHVIDVGLGVGLGFYSGDVYGGQRIQYIDGWKDFEPVNEMFGLSAAYRIDRHWAIQLQGYRQRMMFNDKNLEVTENLDTTFSGGSFFYSPLWNVDVMCEYNILEYIPSSQDVANGSLVPYVALGAGVALFDSAAYFSPYNGRKEGNAYPLIKTMEYGFYAMAGAGLKWHITDGWQLKAAINYQLHFGQDRRGATPIVAELSEGLSHNITMSLGVLYALDFETIATGGRSAYKNNWRKNGMMWWDAMDNYKGGSKGRGARTMKRRKPLWLE